MAADESAQEATPVIHAVWQCETLGCGGGRESFDESAVYSQHGMAEPPLPMG